MEALECIKNRTSIRKFIDKPVEDELIKEIIKAGMCAPSALNRQPWEFYVIDNKEIMDRITAVSPNFDKDSPIQVVVVGRLDYINGGDILDYWIEDCAAVTQNMLLAATALGLGSLWCGVFPRKDRCDAIKEILGLKDNQMPFSFLHFGYMGEEPNPKDKYQEERIHYIK